MKKPSIAEVLSKGAPASEPELPAADDAMLEDEDAGPSAEEISAVKLFEKARTPEEKASALRMFVKACVPDSY